jgi:23S rRNA (adenine-N6)-dimethyltransferase
VSGRRPWGWHRLNSSWAQQIVAGAAIRSGELVVDLGAGTGALTLPLLEAGARVIAVELHPGRARQLRAKVRDHAASVVQCDLEDFVPPGRPFRVVASPPYALTAAVPSFVPRASCLTAADLVCSEPWYDAWSSKATETCAGSRRERGLPLPRIAFVPPPPVDSAVLELRRRRLR